MHDCVLSGDPVEAKLFNYINDNFELFEFDRKLSEKDIVTIEKRFVSQYETIKESPHFDEFMVLSPDVKGDFVVHQGSICIDLSVLSEQYKKYMDFPIYKQQREYAKDFHVEIPHKNKHIEVQSNECPMLVNVNDELLQTLDIAKEPIILQDNRHGFFSRIKKLVVKEKEVSCSPESGLILQQYIRQNFAADEWMSYESYRVKLGASGKLRIEIEVAEKKYWPVTSVQAKDIIIGKMLVIIDPDERIESNLIGIIERMGYCAGLCDDDHNLLLEDGKLVLTGKNDEIVSDSVIYNQVLIQFNQIISPDLEAVYQGCPMLCTAW